MSIVFVFVIGLAVAAVCGYMAGLIGSSNSPPISGVGILVVLIAAILIKATFGTADSSQTDALIAYTLFTAAVVFGVATISNDNLQDLKTGQLVGATPWKQQVALVIGVLFGSAIIPPILGLMYDVFGFVGAPGAGEDALAAPQAGLLSTLAKGVLGGADLDWGGLIGIGASSARSSSSSTSCSVARGGGSGSRRWRSAWACTCRCRSPSSSRWVPSSVTSTTAGPNEAAAQSNTRSVWVFCSRPA